MSSWKSIADDLLELSKPRICLLALVMASLGYVLGLPGEFRLLPYAGMLIGTALVGVSCGSLNMYSEREIDGKMWRTMNRPLPAGRVPANWALVIGLVSGFLGEFILLTTTNSVTAVLGAITIMFYVVIYTPSKQVSSMSTLIGAIPGAMPPLMGSTAAAGMLTSEGFLLFMILFIWQIPHFLAIAWIYKEDYARGGFPILSVIDEQGPYVAKQVILYTMVLLPLTLLPTLWHVAGETYFFGALFLGVVFLIMGVKWAVSLEKESAKALFLYSVVYLPVLSVLMIWDRTL